MIYDVNVDTGSAAPEALARQVIDAIDSRRAFATMRKEWEAQAGGP